MGHLRENGFDVETVDANNLVPIKQEHGVTRALEGCHTALVDGYVVEGHVPADVVKRLLKERPDVKGVAVPGMPAGSPGMPSPNPEPYNVYTFDENGNATVYDRR